LAKAGNVFEQAAIAVQNVQGYTQLHSLLNSAFDDRDVEVLLTRSRRSKLRIRDFDGVLGHGLLGKAATTLYGSLPVSDQALTRERYLQLVESVSPELRQRYLKVYASY
jgi:hypothetical protein